MKPPANAVLWNFSLHRTGDTMIKKEFTITTSHGPLSKVEIKSTTGVVLFTTEGDDPTIEITDAASGAWNIKEHLYEGPAKIYEYEARFTFTNGFVQTYMYGTLEIVA